MLIISEEIDLGLIIVENRDEPVNSHNVEAEPHGKLWFHNIKVFLEDDSSLDLANSVDRRTLRKLTCRFFLSGKTLYKRSHTGLLFKMCDAS